jgi:hypothetical protein
MDFFNPFHVVGWLVLVAYVARVVGAAMDKTKRSRIREVVEALSLPLTMLMSKPPRGSVAEEGVTRTSTLSALRVLAFGMFVVVASLVVAPLSRTDIWGLAIPAGLLVLDTLLAHVPLTEFMAFLTSVFGSGVAKRAAAKVEVDAPAGGGTTNVQVTTNGTAADDDGSVG